MKLLIVLAWWFLSITPQSSQVVGPFRDEADCERIRKELIGKYNSFTTSCWTDGRFW